MEEQLKQPPEPSVPFRDWSELTTVCLLNIFRRLSLPDIWLVAMRVCKSWLDTARDGSLYTVLDLEPAFEAAGDGRPDAAAWWTPAFQRRVDGMMRSAAEWAGGELMEVRVRHCSDGALGFLAERCPNLKILSVRSSQSVTDESISKIANSCPNLIELDISNCYEVSYKSIELIGQNCPNLIILRRNLLNWLDPSQHRGVVPESYLRNLPQDGDDEVSSIAKFMPNLKHLELRFSKLSVTGLKEIAESCSSLEFLDLAGCANLTNRGIEQVKVNLKNIKTIIKPNFFMPRSSYNADRYGHWQLYDERFQTNVFQI